MGTSLVSFSFIMIPSLATILAVISVIATLIYNHFYKKHANQRINKGFEQNIPPKKPMMSPIKFFFIWLLSMIAIFIAIILISFVSYKSNVDFNTVEVDRFQFNVFEEEELKNSLLKDASPSKNIAGYKRFEKKSGQFIFTYYISEEMHETFPEYIVNIRYNGNSKIKLNMDILLSTEDNIVPTTSMYGYETSDDIWVTIYRGEPFDQDLVLNCYTNGEDPNENDEGNVHDNRPKDEKPIGTLTIKELEVEKIRNPDE